MISENSSTLQFWFEFASTYSYLTVGRIRKLCESEKIQIDWKPFLLGPIFKEHGMKDSPFNLFPIKGQYMWKDIQRRCLKYGLPFQKPQVFPQSGLKAARIATAFINQPWIHQFILETYKAEFSRGFDISQESVLSSILNSLGQNPKEILLVSESVENKDALRKNTEEAKVLGIFGAPSFIVNGELFWGDDRLEDAIDFVQKNRIS